MPAMMPPQPDDYGASPLSARATHRHCSKGTNRAGVGPHRSARVSGAHRDSCDYDRRRCHTIARHTSPEKSNELPRPCQRLRRFYLISLLLVKLGFNPFRAFSHCPRTITLPDLGTEASRRRQNISTFTWIAMGTQCLWRNEEATTVRPSIAPQRI